MSHIPNPVADSLERMMEAARRLEDARSRITPEELSLLNECSSRIRLQGYGQVIPYPTPQNSSEPYFVPPKRAVRR